MKEPSPSAKILAFADSGIVLEKNESGDLQYYLTSSLSFDKICSPNSAGGREKVNVLSEMRLGDEDGGGKILGLSS